jgi:hypothetical protein
MDGSPADNTASATATTGSGSSRTCTFMVRRNV